MVCFSLSFSSLTFLDLDLPTYLLLLTVTVTVTLLQDKGEIDSFIEYYKGEVTSDSANKVFSDLATSLQLTSSLAKTAKGLLTEVILSKAVDNHMKAEEQGDAKGKEDSISLIKSQIEFLGDVKANTIGMSELDLCPPLMRFARKILP